MLSSKAWTAVWSAVLQWARVGINAFVFLMLSRWLSLAEIGAVAAAQVPILISQSFSTTAIPDFIVQEKRVTERRLGTVFWLSCAIGLAQSFIVIACSTFIASAISDPNTQAYVYALAICPIAWSISGVSEGLLRRELKTKALAVRTLVASSIAAVVAVIAAKSGFGGWSIVGFVTISTAISTSLTIYSCKWRPGWHFSRAYLRVCMSKIFTLGGRHLLSAAVIPTIQFVTSWQLGTTAGGIFQVSSRVCSIIDSLASTPYRFVVMPLFARSKRIGTDLAYQVEHAIRVGSLISAPAYFGLMAIAPSLLPYLLGARNGQPCVFVVQVLCLNGVLASVSGTTNQVLVARGYATAVLKRTIAMYAFVIIPALAGAWHSVEAVAGIYGLLGGAFGFWLSTLLAKEYFGMHASRMIIGWLRPALAGSAVLLVIPISNLLADLSEFGRLMLSVFCMPVIFAVAAMSVAKADVLLLQGLVRVR